ncbi:MAG: hypothetical protein KGQ59_01090 [Bdellovibrionales bacterium]|nr:hypothetical protein [Bdellovibrionales bacterium]
MGFKWTTNQSRSVLSLFAVLALGGCRFGNQIVQAEDPTGLSGYYKTEAKQMSICTILQTGDWRCTFASTGLIPGTIQNIMTNPVYVSANTAKATAFLVSNNLDTSNYFQMDLGKTGELTSEVSVGSSKALWNDEACQSQLQLGKEGKIHVGTKQKQNSFEVSGSVEFAVSVVTSLVGDCTPTLTDLKSCFQDVNLCPGSNANEKEQQQQSVQDYFAPYIDHGVLTLDEIPQLSAMGWEATYH